MGLIEKISTLLSPSVPSVSDSVSDSVSVSSPFPPLSSPSYDTDADAIGRVCSVLSNNNHDSPLVPPPVPVPVPPPCHPSPRPRPTPASAASSRSPPSPTSPSAPSRA